MTYCVYFKDTGIIQSVSDVFPTSDELSYITLPNDMVNMFLSGNVRLADYRVKHTGELIRYEPALIAKETIDDHLYAIPTNVSGAEFVITQDTTTKTCSAKLHIKVPDQLITLAACVKGNPFSPIWIWTIKTSELLDKDVKINYTGTDAFEFYTKRYFTYSHESI